MRGRSLAPGRSWTAGTSSSRPIPPRLFRDLLLETTPLVQQRLRRPIAVENLSAYLRWADDSLTEAQFFNELARRSGCTLLLDLNNLPTRRLKRTTP